MREITVSTVPAYQVTVGAGLLRSAGAALSAPLSGAGKIAVVTDDNVELLYADALEQSLLQADFEVCRFVLPHGEREKNGENYLRLLCFLAGEGLTRTDAIAALGGGMVGDLAGFAAATYQRGIRYAHLPTSLLAMVDAAVGGKCAIDLPEGKNLAGAFWQPCAVLADTDCLATLPQMQFSDGCGEIVKYAVLSDAALLHLLLRDGRGFDREEVISGCIAQKAAIVAADAREQGTRALLNLGHTVAHAVEMRSGMRVSHGIAVAMGLGVMARACAAAGDCTGADAAAICAALEHLGLPVRPDYPLGELLPWMQSDKKRRGDSITLAVIRGLGRCELRAIPWSELENYLKAGF